MHRLDRAAAPLYELLDLEAELLEVQKLLDVLERVGVGAQVARGDA